MTHNIIWLFPVALKASQLIKHIMVLFNQGKKKTDRMMNNNKENNF